MASPGSVVIQFVAKADKAARDVLGLSKSLDKVDTAASDVDSSLSDAQRAIDKTGSGATGATRDLGKIETGLDGVGDEAENTARRLRQSAGEMAAGIRTGATGIDTETGHIKTSMKEAGSEAGAEFIGNMAEGIGSGTASVTDVVQGTLGGITNLAASIGGPVGLAAGTAAAGIGLVFSALNANAEKTRAKIKTISDALVDLGETSSDAAKQELWDQWLSTLDDGGKTVGQIADGIRIAGVKQGLFKDALTGSTAAQKEIVGKVDEQIAKIETLRQKQGGLGVLDSNRLNALKDVKKQLGLGNDALDTTKDRLGDIESLTGDAEAAANQWVDELRNAKIKTTGVKEDVSDIAGSHAVNFIVTVKDKNGRPVHLGPGQLSLVPPETAPATRAAAPPTVVPTNLVIDVQVDQWGMARVTKRAIEVNDRRQGRKPGAALKVAW